MLPLSSSLKLLCGYMIDPYHMTQVVEIRRASHVPAEVGLSFCNLSKPGHKRFHKRLQKLKLSIKGFIERLVDVREDSSECEKRMCLEGCHLTMAITSPHNNNVNHIRNLILLEVSSWLLWILNLGIYVNIILLQLFCEHILSSKIKTKAGVYLNFKFHFIQYVHFHLNAAF